MVGKSVLSVLSMLVITGTVMPFGLVSYHEPLPVHTPYGVDHAVSSRSKGQLQFTLTPYHSHAAHAKDANHTKGPLGDRLGPINMLGLLIGDGPSPYTQKFGEAGASTVSTLHAAYAALADHVAENASDAIFLGSTYDPLPITDVRYGYGKFMTNMSQRRIGIRGTFDYSFANGLGFAVKGGVAEYSITPSYLGNPYWDSSSNKYINYGETAADGTIAKVIQTKMMTMAKHQLIGKDLGVDFSGVDTTGLEDTSIEFHWRKGFEMRDAEGDLVVTAIPALSIGLAVPTAEKKVTTKLFDISLGNDGFYGITPQAELSFDFPGMIRVGFGGAVTLFNQDNVGKQYVPSSPYQDTLYPWQTTVTKRPGPLWKAYGTICAPNFIDTMSCYISYILLEHQKDTITLTGANKALFYPDKLALDGEYSAQMLHVGFDYEVTPNLRFGGGVQSVFAGKRVWKTTTVFGSLSFVF